MYIKYVRHSTTVDLFLHLVIILLITFCKKYIIIRSLFNFN